MYVFFPFHLLSLHRCKHFELPIVYFILAYWIYIAIKFS